MHADQLLPQFLQQLRVAKTSRQRTDSTLTPRRFAEKLAPATREAWQRLLTAPAVFPGDRSVLDETDRPPADLGFAQEVLSLYRHKLSLASPRFHAFALPSGRLLAPLPNSAEVKEALANWPLPALQAQLQSFTAHRCRHPSRHYRRTLRQVSSSGGLDPRGLTLTGIMRRGLIQLQESL